MSNPSPDSNLHTTTTRSYGSTDYYSNNYNSNNNSNNTEYGAAPPRELDHDTSTSTSTSTTALLPLTNWEQAPTSTGSSSLLRARYYVSRVVHNPVFQWCIVALIIVNAIILGIETIPELRAQNGTLIVTLNYICMVIFVLEVAAKLFAEGIDFFKNGWNYFDVIVLSLSLAPSTGPWSALYALRCLRVLRIISTAKPIKIVAESFVVSLYTASPVFGLLFLILYIGALLSVSFFGSVFPEWYGTLPRALFTMFQVVTLESWSMGIARPVMEVYPYAWAFFVPFIMLSTWTVLNLFIGVVVNTIGEIAKRYADAEERRAEELAAKLSC